MKKTTSVFASGQFSVGCNYWASHAGTAMWSDWRPHEVQKDLAGLARNGLQVLRVFPLWPDFQPLTLLRAAHANPVEFRFGEETLPDDELGQAGVSRSALEHFRFMADCAAEQNLHLVVGLITGFMSGRLFVPPAFEGLDPITNPMVVQWELRFVREFVRYFKDHPAILAWDLGNECNNMGTQTTSEQAWIWTSGIVNTIRSIDSTRPVISGMHCLPTDLRSAWNLGDQGELTDFLTTHPYPPFTPHCDVDPVNTVRSILHATAESTLYADVGGKPCLVEEIGTLGPMFADRQVAANFGRSALWSAWAHDHRSFIWWCAYDQSHLDAAPYDWFTVERELGLCTTRREPKPVIREFQSFRRFLSALPLGSLPPRRREAVCVLTRDQDQWGTAYMAFVLAKLAGFDLTFIAPHQPAPDAELYLMPALRGHRSISRHRFQAILERVRAGATLYLSLDDGLPDGLEALAGVEVIHRSRREEGHLCLDGVGVGLPSIPLETPFRLTLRATRAEVLAAEPDGNPLYTRAPLGRGWVYFLAGSPEKALMKRPDAFTPEAVPVWNLYRQMAGKALRGRVIQSRTAAHIGMTEHAIDSRHRIAVAINYQPEGRDVELGLAKGWKIRRVIRNRAGKPDITVVNQAEKWTGFVSGNDGLILELTKEDRA